MPEYSSDPERMTKLETQMENVVVVVTRMDTKMDTWQQSFASKELLEEKLKARDHEIERLSSEQQRLEKEKAQKEDIKRLEEDKSTNKHTLPLWAAVVLSAVDILILLWAHK